MDSINENKTAESFPFEFLNRFRNILKPDFDKSSNYTTQSFDNRGKISDVADSLRSRMGFLQTRLSSSSFLSSQFAWQVNTAVSSNPNVLLAKAMSGAEEKDYSFKIESLAKSRTAKSERLASDEKSDFETGTYSYQLTVGSETYDIEVDVDNAIGAPATNRTVLLAVERSINRLGAGVTASLKEIQVRDYNPHRENALEKVSFLTVQSDDTGDEVSFSLADTSGTMISDLNLDQVQQFGTQNQYRVNGENQSTDSNQVVVESDLLGAYLLNKSDIDENIRITVETGKKILSDELIKIIEDYNEFIQWVDENDNVISPGLKKQLFSDLTTHTTDNNSVTLEPIEDGTDPVSITGTVGFQTQLNLENEMSVDTDFEDIGLELNMDGTIEISDAFPEAVKADLMDVYNALAGENGFFTKISENIDTIHGKRESNYVFALNSILSYDPEGVNRKSIYKNATPSLISFFA